MLHHTENATTTKIGQCVATVICDTVNKSGDRLTTFELVYPRYIHSELMTHRAFSRNASSSRATPLKVTLEEVKNDPVFFDYVGKNQSGMVAGEEVTGEELEAFKKDWESLGWLVACRINEMSEKYGIHKQTLNRALEPWLRIRTLVTATDWDNWFMLRLAPDAQPEIQSLAKAMKEAMGKSRPNKSCLHLPYITYEELGTYNPEWYKVSVARCARVSYARLDGRKQNIEDDIALYDHLRLSGHWSAFEHVAYPARGRFANYRGWQSLRNVLGF